MLRFLIWDIQTPSMPANLEKNTKRRITAPLLSSPPPLICPHLSLLPLPLGPPTSQPRINLIHHVRTTKRRPIPTRLRHHRGDFPLHNIRRPLHHVDVQPATDMPRDMAMQRPHPRVIGRELDHQVPRLEFVLWPSSSSSSSVAACAWVGDVGRAGFGGRGCRKSSIPPGLDHLRVPSLRVDPIGGAVPFADAFGHDPEVVPVQVHGVGAAGDVDEVAQDDADGGGGFEVVDVPFWV